MSFPLPDSNRLSRGHCYASWKGVHQLTPVRTGYVHRLGQDICPLPQQHSTALTYSTLGTVVMRKTSRYDGKNRDVIPTAQLDFRTSGRLTPHTEHSTLRAHDCLIWLARYVETHRTWQHVLADRGTVVMGKTSRYDGKNRDAMPTARSNETTFQFYFQLYVCFGNKGCGLRV